MSRPADPHVCLTCGAHVPGDRAAPEVCPTCSDERQYVGLHGQRWQRHSVLAAEHATVVDPVEPGLYAVGVEPSVAIGQRALVVCTPEGNLMWDCVGVLTDAGRDAIAAIGGVRTIAVSHPHFYTGIATVAEALGAEVLLHAADAAHVTHPHPRIRHWDGERRGIFGGITLVRAGGHFAGGTVAHWPGGAERRGALLSGDIIQVVPDRRFVGFMYSYPNLIPLPLREVERVAASIDDLPFDRIYGGWSDRVVATGAKGVVARSVERYRRALAGRLDGERLPWPT